MPAEQQETPRTLSEALGWGTSGRDAVPLLDPVVERQLNLPRLRRLIAKRANALVFALGSAEALWHELEDALTTYRERRERAYFELGKRSKQSDRSP